jgi:carbon storage regulator
MKGVAMLVLTRKKGERIFLGNGVVVTVMECIRGRVRLGFDAPESIGIVREEIRSEFQQPSPPPKCEAEST